MSISDLKELLKAITLNRYKRTDSLRYKKDGSRGSPVMEVRPSEWALLVSPFDKENKYLRLWLVLMFPPLPEPECGWAWWAAYFNLFWMAAASVTKPGSVEVDQRYVARESTTTASQIRHQPFCQGTRVRPSGVFHHLWATPLVLWWPKHQSIWEFAK